MVIKVCSILIPLALVSGQVYSSIPALDNTIVCESSVPGACDPRKALKPFLRCPKGTLHGEHCVVPTVGILTCDEGSVLKDFQCESIETIPAEPSCPVGTRDIGGLCQSTKIKGIMERCKAGELENNQCVVYIPESHHKITGCPLGYTEARGSCWKSVEMDCTPREDAGMVEASVHAETCLRHRFNDNNNNNTLPDAEIGVNQRVCEVELEAQPICESRCPEHAIEKNGKCYSRKVYPTDVYCSLGHNKNCFPDEFLKPIFNCPTGYRLNKHVCELLKTTQPNKQCKKTDIMLDDQNCYTILGAAEKTCSTGYQLIGNYCELSDSPSLYKRMY